VRGASWLVLGFCGFVGCFAVAGCSRWARRRQRSRPSRRHQQRPRGAVTALQAARQPSQLGRLWRRPARPRTISLGRGAMAVTETDLSKPAAQAAALRTGMGIAAGIGLHNFSEGLAIGQATRGGQLALAGLLIVGFALHNMTEGFGIVGPLAAAKVRASWVGSLCPGSSAAARPGHPLRDVLQLHISVRGLSGPGRRGPVCHREQDCHYVSVNRTADLYG
jgi:zinc transporter ZupT